MARVLGGPYGPNDPIVHGEDLSSVVERIPPSYRVRGLLFARLLESLEPAIWQGLAPSLREPPPRGHYVAFQSYPYADYHELLLATAGARFPSLNQCEAIRRLARDDFTTFAESVLGRVSLKLVSGPKSALLRLPGIYEAMASGEWRVDATELDDRTVRVSFEQYFGVWPYQLGQVEEVVRRLGGEPFIDVRVPAPRELRLHVRYA